MRKAPGPEKRILTLLLMLSMVFFCVFSFDDGYKEFAESLVSAQNSDSLQASGRTILRQPVSSRITDSQLSRTRTSAELEKERVESSALAQGLYGSASYLLRQFFALLFFLLLYFLMFMMGRSILTPRFSIIRYLHRSDGEKPASLLFA